MNVGECHPWAPGCLKVHWSGVGRCGVSLDDTFGVAVSDEGLPEVPHLLVSVWY